jgi:glucan biosynthesis protein
LKCDLSQKVQNLKYVTDFVSDSGLASSSWDAEKIKSRAKDMAIKAYREIWKIN